MPECTHDSATCVDDIEDDDGYIHELWICDDCDAEFEKDGGFKDEQYEDDEDEDEFDADAEGEPCEDYNDCPIREKWGYCHCDYPGHERDSSIE